MLNQDYLQDVHVIPGYSFDYTSITGSTYQCIDEFSWYYNNVPYTGYAYVVHSNTTFHNYYALYYYEDGYTKYAKDVRVLPNFNPLAKALYS